MNFQEIYDVSLPLSNAMAFWPGDPSPQIRPFMRISEGAVANASQLSMSVHTGTHMDAPHHFIDGQAGIDQFALSTLVGTAQVVELEVDHHIGAADLEAANLPAGTERILFKTGNSNFWKTEPAVFHTDFIAVAEDGARWLVEHGVKLVGVDYLSVERFDAPEDHPVHKILLGANVVVIEGLDLGEIEPGEYTLMALPMRITNGDGAPARVLLAR
jgi:arylformamidase